MIVSIDASNIRDGGGVTHLVEFLRAADPTAAGISQVVVWAGTDTLQRIEERTWLKKFSLPVLDRKAFLFRAFWQRFFLAKLARSAKTTVLFVPGGSYAGSFRPVVTMSRNMLPFETREFMRFGWSWRTLKMALLRIAQTLTFRRVAATIFLTQYAQDVVTATTGPLDGKTRIIPHGIDARFNRPPKIQLPIDHFDDAKPLQILYVSIVDMYKHQWRVAEAVSQLHTQGYPVSLTLIGPAQPPALKRLRRTLDHVDPSGHYIRYLGAVPHSELHRHYEQADLCAFASSCENMPNILLEGMASGLPVACSNRGPMPEVLGDAGVYFDPESSTDIARALRELIDSPGRRSSLARASYERVRQYSWSRCARETLSFLAEVASASK